MGAAVGSGEGADPERKQVTVLFADVKGSMGLSGSVDAECWWRVMGGLFELMSKAMHRFEGRVDQFTGDGMMAVFGAPVAQEDHAVRACHAALGLRADLARYARELEREQGLGLAVRMGLDSGDIVAGNVGDEKSLVYTAIGRTAGLAQRMESVAEPGSVYLTGRTAALVQGLFELREIGETRVKGVEEPVHAFELVGVGKLRTLLERSEARGFSPFVGRGDELASIESALAGAVDGSGQFVAVAGEPGIGKSRLCHEFLERCGARGVEVYRANAVAHGQRLPFATLLSLLRGFFSLAEDEDANRVRENISRRALAVDAGLEEELGLIFELLGTGDSERPVGNVDPQARQRRLFSAISRILLGHSETTPTVLLVEDLQWLDAGTEAFLSTLAEALPGSRMLVLVTFRPGNRVTWIESRISLAPLARGPLNEMIEAQLGRDPSLDGLSELLGSTTGGNPFFVEEVVRALAETGVLSGRPGNYHLTRAEGEIAVPPSVEAVLAARIDRLAERERRLLQTAAVIGGSIPTLLLQRAGDLSTGELTESLRGLVDAELMSGTSTKEEWTLRHALTEQVAYRSMLSDRRRRLHAAVASAIVDLETERHDQLAALIAYHWEYAAEIGQAARWSARAAGSAGFSDPGEAIRRWRDVKRLTDQLPESAERTELAVGSRLMLMNLAWRLGRPDGQTTEEYQEDAAALFDEGRALAERDGNLPQQAMLMLVYAVLRLQYDVEEAVGRCREAIALADRTGVLSLRIATRPVTSSALLAAGRLPEAREVGEEGIALATNDPGVGTDSSFANPFAGLLVRHGIVIARMGELARAESLFERGLEVAEAHGDVENGFYAHGAWAYLNYLRGDDGDVTLERAQCARQLTERYGAEIARGFAEAVMATAHVSREEWPEAVLAAERALSILQPRQTGRDFEPLILTLLSEARLNLGEIEAARAAAQLALAQGDERGDRGFEIDARLALARVLRVSEGSLASKQIEDQLTCALRVAEESGARAIEPRVRLELAELAALRGDNAGRLGQLGLARELFEKIGAPSLAARVPVAVS